MNGPLSSLKILDFTTLLPGPFATLAFSDLGAEVLRVVSPSRRDLVEEMVPAAAAALNRGKDRIALDLKDEKSVERVRSLVKSYDIVFEQFRPGVMDRLGLGYENLAKENPGLIYCSITGYGQSGPMSRRAGHDINYLARSGAMGYSGRKVGGPPPMGIQIADLAGGSQLAVIGVLAAVVHRNVTGEGQYVDISITDGCFALNVLFGAACLAGDENDGPESNILNGGSLYDYYETADGRYLSFGPIEEKFYDRFCECVQRPEWVREGITPEDLKSRKRELGDLFRSKTLEEWMQQFASIDVCIEPVLFFHEAMNDKHIRERGMVIEVPSTTGDRLTQIANPIKFSRTKKRYEI